MAQDLQTLADDYVRVWDVRAPKDLANSVFVSEVIDHNPQPGQGPGLEGFSRIVALYQQVFPDLHLTTEDVIISGDHIAVRWSALGTHEGDQLGVPATHREVRLSGIDILYTRDGRVVERWGEGNGLEMMQQIAPG
jgi:predicted ester cyclase